MVSENDNNKTRAPIYLLAYYEPATKLSVSFIYITSFNPHKGLEGRYYL